MFSQILTSCHSTRKTSKVNVKANERGVRKRKIFNKTKDCFVVWTLISIKFPSFQNISDLKKLFFSIATLIENRQHLPKQLDPNVWGHTHARSPASNVTREKSRTGCLLFYDSRKFWRRARPFSAHSTSFWTKVVRCRSRRCVSFEMEMRVSMCDL